MKPKLSQFVVSMVFSDRTFTRNLNSNTTIQKIRMVKAETTEQALVKATVASKIACEKECKSTNLVMWNVTNILDKATL